MTRRTLLAAATLIWAVPALAQEIPGAPGVPGTHEGKVVTAGGGKLVMIDRERKNQRAYTVGADANITLEGRGAKLEDLKVGFAVRVTAEKKGDQVVVTRIEAKNVD